MPSLVANRLAKTVSILTNPALLVSFTTLVVIYHYAHNPREFWLGSVIGIILLIGPGLVYSINLWRQEGYVDLDISNRQERIVPLMLTCLGAVIGTYLVQSRLGDPKFVEIGYILVTLLTATTIITTVWKISLHAITLSALVTLLVIFRGETFGLGYLVLIPIAWSRLYLKQHTQTQLVAGTLLGIILTALAAWLFKF